MSIVNVFGFLFESEGADKVKEDFDDINKKTKQLTQAVAKLITTYASFKKVISGVTAFAQTGEDIALMAQRAGVGAETIQKYGAALKNYGGGMSSAASTLSKLNSQLQDLKFGKGGAMQNVAMRYGISVYGKNGIAAAEEMLVNIARRMEGLNTQAQLDLGKKLGLDPATLALVQGGVANLNKELEKASNLTVYSDEDLKRSREFQRLLREMRAYLEKIGAIISRTLLPPMTWIAEKLSKIFELISRHKGFVLGFFGTLAGIMGVIAASTIATYAPFLALVAAITAVGAAIGLLIDDFITWREGGESMIGWMAKPVEAFNKLHWAIKLVATALAMLVLPFAGFAGLLIFLYMAANTLAEMVTSFVLWLMNVDWSNIGESIKNAFMGTIDAIKEWGDTIKSIIGDAWDWITDKIAGFFLWFFEKWESLKGVLKSLKFWGKDTEVEENINIGKEAMAQTANTLPLMGATTNSNANNSVSINEVNIKTEATDSEGISKSIVDTLSGQFQDLLFQNAGGTK